MNAVVDTLQDTIKAEEAQAPDALKRPGKLSIVSGVQQGASAWLQPSVALTLGSSLANDIVLRDISVESKHLMIMLEADVIRLQCLSGSMLVDGMPVLAGDRAVASASALVQIGSVALSINVHQADEDRSQLSQEPVRGADGLDAMGPLQTEPSYFMPQIDSLPAATEVGDLQQTVQGTESKAGGHAGFFTLAALSLGAVIVWQSGLFSPDAEEPASLTKLLVMSPFTGLMVAQEGNAATVTGYVDTVHESMQLGQWLEQSGLLIQNDVMVGETLGEQVADVFRVNGVMAEVDVAEGGIVVAITQEADTKLIKIIEERIMTDVPLVAQLQIDNTPPPVVQTKDATTVADPGKRVAMVVSDEPAYIVTEDKSRYFVGSLLPTGHRIADIKDGKVSLEKQGIITTLEF